MPIHPILRAWLATGLLVVSLPALGTETKPRARELGVPFDGTPGALNAITDVTGVEVGHTTIVRGEGALEVGVGPVRTGVTAILPRGRQDATPVFAGWHSLNGNGEMTGTAWIEESGFLDGPVMITNTHSVGVVHDAVIAYRVRKGEVGPGGSEWSLPVVAETWDGWLNDLNGFHVKPEHVFAALDAAHGGAVSEGAVGGGTGMICNEFKGGIGTASRRLSPDDGGYTVGVLVQCNYGLRPELRIAGVPVGREIPEEPAYAGRAAGASHGVGSIIIVVATDAPLLPHQLERLARRAGLGLARTGSVAHDGSGDLFLAFSTAPLGAGWDGVGPLSVQMLAGAAMDPLFSATVEATEEAIVNAMIAAETMVGIDGHRAIALPHERLREVLRRYNRLNEPR